VPVVDVPVVGSAGCEPAGEVEPEVAPVSVGVELEVPSCPVAGGAPVAPVVVPAPVIVPAPVGVPAVRGVSELVPVWVVPVLGVVVWLLLPVPGLAVLGLPVGIEPSSAPTFPAVCESLPVVGELPRSAVGAAVVCPVSLWPAVAAVVAVAAARWLLVAAFWTPLLSDSVPKSVCVPAFTGVALTGWAVATAPAVKTTGWLGALGSPTDPAEAGDPLADSPDPNDAAGATPADGASEPPECASPPDRPLFRLAFPAPTRS
jgi:hypothetical protein